MKMSVIIEKAKKGDFVLIAEIGVNYYDIAIKLNLTPIVAAKLMILEAKKAGIHAVKFQSYKAELLTVRESPSYWDTNEENTKSQYELFKKFDSFGEAEYRLLSNYCKEIGIEFLSTPFDFFSANYLYELMEVYKISSSDLNNHPFIEYQSKKGKPILLSTGASNEEEISQSLNIIRKWNQEPLVLLHCVLEYPTPVEHANLNRILALKNKFPDVIIGYSDHTKPDAGMDILKTAYSLGACVIEKHFTLDKSIIGNDHYHSMDVEDAKRLINDINMINKARGQEGINFQKHEETARTYARRSIVSMRKILAGEILEQNMFTFKRPGTGISPSQLPDIIGKKAVFDIDEDTVLLYTMFE